MDKIIIRKKPLFELKVENDFLIINNTNYKRDNMIIKISDIDNLEIIRHLSPLNKVIEVMFGFFSTSKSNDLRIKMSNGFKDIVLTNCEMEKVEIAVYSINQIILSNINQRHLS
ncbi:MAG: hypothetical protein V4548_06590 [Bacteroidota bacterium]